ADRRDLRSHLADVVDAAGHDEQPGVGRRGQIEVGALLDPGPGPVTGLVDHVGGGEELPAAGLLGHHAHDGRLDPPTPHHASRAGVITNIGVLMIGTTSRTSGRAAICWTAASSRSRGSPGLASSWSIWPGSGAAAATLMPARGPPLLSWSSTRVSAVVEMVSR